jgi:predicted dehydrogenase
VEAIYNPLPNHLHVPWSIKAAEAGKHVLCEKPISLTVEEAISLLKTRDRTGVKIEEAFMVRAHPQWRGVLDLISKGRIGEVRSVMGYFSYNLRDPKNVRNILDYGGGGLMDIGCYLVYTSRLVFGEEPSRVSALIETDPEMRTDVLASGILHFPYGQSVFTCSTQIVPYQRVQILGTKGRIEIEIPFMLHLTSLVGYLSMTGLISLAGARRSWSSRSVTNIRSKAISFRKAYVRGLSCLYRWRVLSGTWQ